MGGGLEERRLHTFGTLAFVVFLFELGVEAGGAGDSLECARKGGELSILREGRFMEWIPVAWLHTEILSSVSMT